MKAPFALATFFLILSSPSFALASSPAVERAIDGCRAFQFNRIPSPETAMKIGVCVGSIDAAIDHIHFYESGDSYCSPPNTTTSQMAAQLVRWSDRNRKVMQGIDSPLLLILTALPEIYPCAKEAE